VAVLSRGYQRDRSLATLVVEPDSKVEQVGDEPLLMLRKFRRDLRAPLPCPSVIVGSQRYRSGLIALERFHSDVMLLDHGFQHLPLARNCDLVLIDATNPFGGGYLLPAGFLREPVAHLRRAAAFIITRCNEVPELESIFQVVKTFNPAAPVFTAIHAFDGFRELGGHATVSAETLIHRRLLAVSGLGNPGSFYRLLKTKGIEPLVSRDFPDHHEYNDADRLEIARTCREQKLDALVTSEKDESKLLPCVEQLKIPCYVMMVKLAIQPEKEFENMLLAYL
jgi:tetraacyldisaccharide 4'-kinase